MFLQQLHVRMRGNLRLFGVGPEAGLPQYPILDLASNEFLG